MGGHDGHGKGAWGGGGVRAGRAERAGMHGKRAWGEGVCGWWQPCGILEPGAGVEGMEPGSRAWGPWNGAGGAGGRGGESGREGCMRGWGGSGEGGAGGHVI